MRADAKENRQAIINAAQELFASQGGDVSLRAIASAAGVGIGTLYRHFPTRDDLIIAVFTDMTLRVEEVIDRHLATWDPTCPEKTWHTFAHEIVSLQLAALAEGIISGLSESKRVWAATSTNRQLLTDAYSRILQQASSAGLVSPDLNPWRFHFGLVAVARPLPELSEFISPGQATWLVDTFLAGVRPQEG